MAYKVSYMTPEKPEIVPSGATVEKVSDLGEPIETHIRRAILVERDFGTDVYIEITEIDTRQSIGAIMRYETALRVHAALGEALGIDEDAKKGVEVPTRDRVYIHHGFGPAPIHVKKVVDKDGDTWTEIEGGRWACGEEPDGNDPGRYFGNLVEEYGPVYYEV